MQKSERTGTVAASVIARLVGIGTAAGIASETLTEAAGVTGADLSDPDARIPLAAEIALWHLFSKQVADPAFAIRAGATFQLRQSGLFGYLASLSATLRDSLCRVERFSSLLSSAVKWHVETEGGQSAITVACHPLLGAGAAFALEYRLASVLKAARDITRAEIVPVEVAFRHPQPSSILAHREHFRCPLRFGAPAGSLRFRSVDFELAIPRSDETLVGYLNEYAEQVVASLVKGDSLQDRLRAAIWSALGDGKPSLERVAAALQLAPRTLQRQLAAEGTSLHRELDELRRSMALAALRDRSHSIAEVAYLLGYAEPSAFFRSFKRWTGNTPRAFRSRAT